MVVAMSLAPTLPPNLKERLVVEPTPTKFDKPPEFTVPPPPIPHFIDPLAVGAGEGGCLHSEAASTEATDKVYPIPLTKAL